MTPKTLTKITLPTTVALAATLFLLPGAAGSQDANAATRTIRPAPVIDVNGPARNVETYSDDIALINRCIEAGNGKSQCLCVAKVMKYELTVSDYREVARPQNTYQASVGQMRELSPRRDLTALIASPSFEYRCVEASRYFGR